MRIYYIFFINEEMYKQTKNNQYALFKLLEKIYFMGNEDILLGMKLFEKLTDTIDKDNLNRLIKSIHQDNMNYINYNYVHIINDFYSNENTKLMINNIFLKIKTTSSFPTFFKDIKNYKNVFICDFINLDYFYLKDLFVSEKIGGIINKKKKENMCNTF